MISKTIGFRGTQHFQTHPLGFHQNPFKKPFAKWCFFPHEKWPLRMAPAQPSTPSIPPSAPNGAKVGWGELEAMGQLCAMI